VGFNFHGYPWLIHKLVYRRSNQERIHVRGYKEQGNIDTPLELAIINQIDRLSWWLMGAQAGLGSGPCEGKDEEQRHQVPHLIP
jgi:phosphoketolase